MAPSSSAYDKDTTSLLTLATTSTALISHFLTTLSSTTPPPSTLPATTLQDPPHPLQVLKDAALLLKSHTTKLGLLLLNKPFTPSAVERVLRDITGQCLPAMISAVELAMPEAWGSLLRAEVVARVRRAVKEVGVCVEEVKSVAITAAEDKAQGSASGKDEGVKRDTLTSTGVVWAACDALVELEELDVGGVALIKALQYKALLTDALAELKEWGEEKDEDEDEDEDGDEGVNEDDLAIDDEDVFGMSNVPKDRPDLKVLLDDATGKIKKVEILFTALIKRRIKAFTKDRARYKVLVQKVDVLVDGMKEIVEATDDIAGAFYDLDETAVGSRVKELVEKAHDTIRPVTLSWLDTEDEFSEWSRKWVELVR